MVEEAEGVRRHVVERVRGAGAAAEAAELLAEDTGYEPGRAVLVQVRARAAVAVVVPDHEEAGGGEDVAEGRFPEERLGTEPLDEEEWRGGGVPAGLVGKSDDLLWVGEGGLEGGQGDSGLGLYVGASAFEVAFEVVMVGQEDVVMGGHGEDEGPLKY